MLQTLSPWKFSRCLHFSQKKTSTFIFQKKKGSCFSFFQTKIPGADEVSDHPRENIPKLPSQPGLQQSTVGRPSPHWSHQRLHSPSSLWPPEFFDGPFWGPQMPQLLRSHKTLFGDLVGNRPLETWKFWLCFSKRAIPGGRLKVETGGCEKIQVKWMLGKGDITIRI